MINEQETFTLALKSVSNGKRFKITTKINSNILSDRAIDPLNYYFNDENGVILFASNKSEIITYDYHDSTKNSILIRLNSIFKNRFGGVVNKSWLETSVCPLILFFLGKNDDDTFIECNKDDVYRLIKTTEMAFDKKNKQKWRQLVVVNEN